MPYKPTGRPPGRPPHPEPLTPAEQRVLRHIREGLPNSEIATRLGVSPDAVKYHVSNMLGKLQLENREQLAAWREPSLPRRVWAGLTGLGWKAAVGGGVAAAAVVVSVVAVALLRGSDEETATFGPEDLRTGVLSVGYDGTPANGPSSNPSISADGRYVAFESEASNLVREDNNGVSDIFVTDRLTGKTWRVSNGMNGQEANGPSYRPSISVDGKWVAFDSEASNLVKDDVNGDVSRAVNFIPENMVDLVEPGSLNRGSIVPQSPHWAGSDVFIANISTGELELVSVTSGGEHGNLGSFAPSVSGDGRFVAFESLAPNLRGAQRGASGPGTGYGFYFSERVFLRDRQARATIHLSQAKSPEIEQIALGSALATISADGSLVAFVSRDARLNLDSADSPPGRPSMGGVYLWERAAKTLLRVPMPAGGAATQIMMPDLAARPVLSRDASLLAFAISLLDSGPGTDAVERRGVWIYRRGDTAAELLPESSSGVGGPLPLSFSPSAATLVTSVTSTFGSAATLEGGTIYDVATGTPTKITLPPGFEGSFLPSISGDGKWILATQFLNSRAPSGRPSTDIVVFSAP